MSLGRDTRPHENRGFGRGAGWAPGYFQSSQFAARPLVPARPRNQSMRPNSPSGSERGFMNRGYRLAFHFGRPGPPRLPEPGAESGSTPASVAGLAEVARPEKLSCQKSVLFTDSVAIILGPRGIGWFGEPPILPMGSIGAGIGWFGEPLILPMGSFGAGLACSENNLEPIPHLSQNPDFHGVGCPFRGT